MVAGPIFAQIITGQLPFDTHDFTLIVVAVVATFLVVSFLVGLGGAMWALIRRSPPLSVEIDRRVQEEMADFQKGFAEDVDRLSTDIRDLTTQQQTDRAELLGKIDAIRTEGEARSNAIALTLQNGFTDLHRALGNLEGFQKAQAITAATASTK